MPHLHQFTMGRPGGRDATDGVNAGTCRSAHVRTGRAITAFLSCPSQTMLVQSLALK